MSWTHGSCFSVALATVAEGLLAVSGSSTSRAGSPTMSSFTRKARFPILESTNFTRSGTTLSTRSSLSLVAT